MKRKYLGTVKVLLFVVLIGASFFGGLLFRQINTYLEPSRSDSRLSSLNEMAPSGRNQEQLNRNVDFGPMDTYLTVLKLVRRNYVDKVGDDYDNRLALASIENMLAALRDPYSRVISSSMRTIQKEAADGEHQGIGAVLGFRAFMQNKQSVHRLVVVTPLIGSPAEKAGLLPGDVIVSINDRQVVDTPPDGRPSQGMKDLIDRLRREAEQQEAQQKKIDSDKTKNQTDSDSTATSELEANTIDIHDAMDLLAAGENGDVKISVKRVGILHPLQIRVALRKIHPNSMEACTLNSNVLYLRVLENDTTALESMHKALADSPNDKYLILDLRRNAGGSVDTMSRMAGYLMNPSTVAQIARRDGRHDMIRSAKESSRSFQKILVLVDGGTAGTSEILASALKTQSKAILIGGNTFGLTLIQSALPLRDGSTVLLTTGRMLTSNGMDLSGKGLRPDLMIVSVPTGKAESDAALRKALEAIKS